METKKEGSENRSVKDESEVRAKDRIKKSRVRNKAKRDGGSVKEIVRFGPNGSSTAPAVTIKQQVDAIIRPGR